MDLIRSIARNRLSHIAFAFIVLGGWAVWANRAHPMPAPLIAGVVQGLISASLTVALQWVIGKAYGKSGNTGLSIGIASMFSLCTISGLHWLTGTPEILTTIAVPWLVGVSYIVLYTLGLQKRTLR